MKLPKTIKTYCPYCKAHQEHKVSQVKKRGKNKTHPISRGSKVRVRLRGEWRGHGNLGRYSKPPKPKMTGKKISKKVDLKFTCKVCGKSHNKTKGSFRAKKVEIKS